MHKSKRIAQTEHRQNRNAHRWLKVGRHRIAVQIKFKYLRAEAGSELLKVDHAVVVSVELHEQFNAVLL